MLIHTTCVLIFGFITFFRKKLTRPDIHGIFAQLGFYRGWSNRVWPKMVRMFRFTPSYFSYWGILTDFRLESTCLTSGLELKCHDGRRKLKLCMQVVNDLYYVCAKFHPDGTIFRIEGEVVTSKKIFLAQFSLWL